MRANDILKGEAHLPLLFGRLLVVLVLVTVLVLVCVCVRIHLVILFIPVEVTLLVGESESEGLLRVDERVDVPPNQSGLVVVVRDALGDATGGK